VLVSPPHSELSDNDAVDLISIIITLHALKSQRAAGDVILGNRDTGKMDILI
jgi:hypothetical protein